MSAIQATHHPRPQQAAAEPSLTNPGEVPTLLNRPGSLRTLALLRALVTNADRVVENLPRLGPDTDQAAGLDVELRRQGLGHAIIETLRHGSTLATFVPAVVGRVLADDSIIDLGI